MDKKFQHSTWVKFKGLYIFISSLSLLLGGIIYILFRSSDFLFFRWIDALGLSSWLNISRQNSLSLSPFIPDWIIFSLPNGLWAFAYSLIISGIWSGSQSVLKYFWMVSIPVLVLGFEFLQLAGIITGTFCFQDIAFGLAGIFAGIITGRKLTKNKDHEH